MSGSHRTIGSIFMTSGFKPGSRAFALNAWGGLSALVLVIFVPAEARSQSSSSQWTLEELVAQLSAHRKSSIAFEEATYSSLLTEPLKSRGTLRFTPPATLAKEITEPHRERYVIDGDAVTFESSRTGVKKTISLQEYPSLRTFVEAFRASLTGDAPTLKRLYETTVQGDRRNWTLLLRPLEPSGKQLVDYILLSGANGQIASIAIRAPDGDRSVLTLRRGPP